MKSKLFVFTMLIGVVFFAGCNNDNGQSAATEVPPTEAVSTEGITFTVGDVANQIDEATRQMQPFADYLASQLVDAGVSTVEVRIAPSLDVMAEWLASGEVDFYTDSSFPTSYVSALSDSQPILRQWRGASEYHSVFFTQADSGITSLDDLKGHIIVFESPFSTSGYFLPSIHLIENGYTLVNVEDFDTEVDADSIGYIFSNDDDNTMTWVITGRAIAGVTDNLNYSGLPEDTLANLVIVAETQSLPRRLASVSPTIDPELRDALVAVLTSMDDEGNTAGLEALESLRTIQFDEIPDGAEAFKDHLNELYSILQEQAG